MIDHERFREMTAAYALGALEAAEAEELRRHLRSCAECSEELAEHGAVTLALAQSAPPVAPSSDAKRRLLALASDDAAAAALLRSKSADGYTARFVHRRPAPAAWWAGIATAGVLAAAVVGIEDMRYRTDAQRYIASIEALAAARERSAAKLRVAAQMDRLLVTALAGTEPVAQSWGDEAHGWWCRVVMPAGGHPGMVVTVAPPPPPGRVYQVWLVRKGRAHSAGMMKSGTGMVLLPMPPAKGDMLAFTFEPLRGSAAPTGAYIMTHTM